MRFIKTYDILYTAIKGKKVCFVEIKRKIYDKLCDWKRTAKGTKALLIEGARRIGKSTVAEELGKNEYRSYILVDFN